jgi:NADH-quinone oxidoreductase subunit J
MLPAILFYLFAALTIAGAVLTITRRNAVASAVWLTLSLLGVAGLFLLQGAEFLFVAQILLYIGGITLLFLFVIMLVNLEAAAHLRQFQKYWPVALLASLGLAGELCFVITRAPVSVAPAQTAPTVGNTEQIAEVLLGHYLVAFELISVLLLTAIVGSVWMGRQRVAKKGQF